MLKINKFVFFGERCSGTNFLEEAITTNFVIEYSHEFGNKHFFCFNKYNNNHDDILFIGIVRNPIYWLNSFSVNMHHIPKENTSLKNFLFAPFYSVETTDPVNLNFNGIFALQRKKKQEYILKEDLNYTTGKMYKNIFELRKMKNKYLMEIMPKKVKNYILINYEDLLYNYEESLSFIRDKFLLIQRYSIFKKIQKYKKSDKIKFVAQRKILFAPEIITILWQNLDKEQEELLGYVQGEDNFKLKNESATSRILSINKT
jgi:hypothetical protein